MRLSLTKALLLAVSLITALAGCETAEDVMAAHYMRVASWLGYFSGVDFKEQCLPGLPDRFRIVTRETGPARFRVADVLEEPATGGAVVRLRTIEASALAKVDPNLNVPGDPATVQTRRLTVEQFRTLIRGFDDPHAPQRTIIRPGVLQPGLSEGGFDWIFCGCRRGRWFLFVGISALLPPTEQVGLFGTGPFEGGMISVGRDR